MRLRWWIALAILVFALTCYGSEWAFGPCLTDGDCEALEGPE